MDVQKAPLHTPSLEEAAKGTVPVFIVLASARKLLGYFIMARRSANCHLIG